jgi:hypothetical protein
MREVHEKVMGKFAPRELAQEGLFRPDEPASRVHGGVSTNGSPHRVRTDLAEMQVRRQTRCAERARLVASFDIPR